MEPFRHCVIICLDWCLPHYLFSSTIGLSLWPGKVNETLYFEVQEGLSLFNMSGPRLPDPPHLGVYHPVEVGEGMTNCHQFITEVQKYNLRKYIATSNLWLQTSESVWINL